MANSNRIILYRTPLVFSLMRVGHARNDNPPMNRSNFVLYQGADATVEFIVRNTDRKPINLLGKTLTITLLDPQFDTVVLTKRLRLIDPYKGTCRVRFSPGDLVGVLPQFYVYSILMGNDDGTSELLMTDQNATARGVLEVKDGVLPEPVRSTEVQTQPWDQLTPVSVGNPPVVRYHTQAVASDGNAADPDGVHTVVIYSKAYRGRLRVQGSLVDLPNSLNDNWFDVDLGAGGPLEFAGECGIDAYNFIGHYRWVRFILEPSLNNEGCITKILLRN